MENKILFLTSKVSVGLIGYKPLGCAYMFSVIFYSDYDSHDADDGHSDNDCEHNADDDVEEVILMMITMRMRRER